MEKFLIGLEIRVICEDPRLKIEKTGLRDARLGVLDFWLVLRPSSACLPVMLLTIDIAARSVQVTLETLPFARAETVAGSPITVFDPVDTILLTVEP